MRCQIVTSLLVLLLWGAQAPVCTVLCADAPATPAAMPGCHDETPGAPAPADDSDECLTCVDEPPSLSGWQPASPDSSHALFARVAPAGHGLRAVVVHHAPAPAQPPPPRDLLLVKSSLLL